jgi:quercetin dioxygenase-like cupin family protein
MDVVRKQPTVKGPPQLFTGDVWLDVIATPSPPSRLRMGSVHFTPGARTAWHVTDAEYGG